MRDLSVKGIARQYAGVTSALSLKETFYSGNVTGTASLRSKLESLARTEHSFKKAECIYKWTAAFEQTWTHIVIRIRLQPAAGISATTMNSLRTTWENGIETTWSNRMGCARAGELPCPLTLDVQWVANGEHHTVSVSTSGATVMTSWHTFDAGSTAAHEVGHMLGNVDEYTISTCPKRSPTGTGNVMDNNSNVVPQRLLQHLATNIGSHIVNI